MPIKPILRQIDQGVLPHNPQSEIGVLGTIFAEATLDDSTYLLDEALAKGVDSNWFYDAKHQIIWEAIVRVYRHGEHAPEVPYVFEDLHKTQQIEHIGGFTTLSDIQNRVETTVWGLNYLKSLRSYYQRRLLIKACARATEEAHSPIQESPEGLDPNADLFGQLDQELISIQDDSAGKIPGAKDIVKNIVKRLDEAKNYNGQPTGIRTGLTALDTATTGFHPGQLIILAARPSMGKSALAGEWAKFVTMPHICKPGCSLERHGVLVFSYEMTKEEYLERILSSLAKINLKKIHRLGPEEIKHIGDMANALAEAPIFVEEDSSVEVHQMVAKTRQVQRTCKREYGCDLGLIIVDYIQIMPTSRLAKTRDQAVGMLSRGLKLLGRKTRLPVIALSQLNREIEKTQRNPQLSDLRESGSLEQDSDAVMFIGPRNPGKFDKTAQERELTLFLAKQRNGPLKDVYLDFIPQHMTMTDDIRNP